VAEVTAVDPGAALRFYRERFSNAANFTFFITGPFIVDAVVPLLEKYIGSLPSTGMADSVRDPDVPSFPSSVVTDTVRKGREPRSQVAVTFFADAGGDAAHEERAMAIASILQARLLQRLRGVLGATYTVSARWGSLGRGYGTLAVSFVCAPEATGRLTMAAIEEATRLNRDGPTADEVATAKATRATDLKTRMAQNGYWIDAMERARRDGRPASSVATDPNAIVSVLTVDDLKDAARRYLAENRYTVVTLQPEAP
jgi:zinc protease